MVPFIDETVILGGFYTPGVGIVDSLQAGTLMRQAAQDDGRPDGRGRASRSPASTSVDGHVRRVRTDAGRHRGRHRRHRLRRVEPADRPDGRRVDPAHAGGPPDDRHRAGAALRAHDQARSASRSSATWTRTCTSASTGRGFEVGSYAHRAILMDADDIPSIEASALSPTMLPFTQEDFDPQLEDALELFPEIVGDESVGVKLAINGLLSLTPDGNPIIGETPEVKGLWSVAAIWIKEAPGIAKVRRGVDDQRRARDRPARLGHRPLLRAPQDRAAHRRAGHRGLQQDLRHRPPDGAVGLEPADPPVPGVRPARRARAPSSSRRPAGSGRSGTAPTRRSSASTATG